MTKCRALVTMLPRVILSPHLSVESIALRVSLSGKICLFLAEGMCGILSH